MKDLGQQRAKHKKAIKLLRAIQECERRINDNYKAIGRKSSFGIVWNTERLHKNTAIKNKLENYYNNNFKI